MSQSTLGTINPATTDGPALATLLSNAEAARLSNNSGAARPAYAVPGTIWVDTSNATTWKLYFWDGDTDIKLGDINLTANTFEAVKNLSAYATTTAVASAITSALASYVLTSAIGTAAAKNVGTSAGQVPVLDPGGKLPALDASQLTHNFGFRAPDVWVRDEKNSGTAGGATVAATYKTRDLTVVKRNVISGASLNGSNQIVLPAGKYQMRFSAPTTGAVGLNRCALYDVTSATYLGFGSNSSGVATVTNISMGDCYVESAAGLLIELRHRAVTAVATSGLGGALSFGDVEVYGDVQIWRVD